MEVFRERGVFRNNLSADARRLSTCLACWDK
jgi:hypothetical protein